MSRAGMPARRLMHPSHTARFLDPSGALSRSLRIVADATGFMKLPPLGSLPLPGLPRRRPCPALPLPFLVPPPRPRAAMPESGRPVPCMIKPRRQLAIRIFACGPCRQTWRRSAEHAQPGCTGAKRPRPPLLPCRAPWRRRIAAPFVPPRSALPRAFAWRLLNQKVSTQAHPARFGPDLGAKPQNWFIPIALLGVKFGIYNTDINKIHALINTPLAGRPWIASQCRWRRWRPLPWPCRDCL